MTSIYKKLAHTDTQYQKVRKILTHGSNGAFLVKVFGAILSFSLQVLLARVLGAKHFGDYVYVITLINILRMFGEIGFDRSSLRFIPSYKSGNEWGLVKGFLRQSNKLVLASSILLSLLVLAVIWILQESIRADLIVLLCISPLLLVLQSFSLIVCAKIQAFKHVVLAQLPHFILHPLLLGVIILIFHLGSGGSINAHMAFSTNIFVTIMITIFALWCLRFLLPKELSHVEPHFDTHMWLKVSFVLALISGFNLIIRQTDILMIGMLHDTTDSGIYMVAKRVTRLIGFASLAINAISAPLIAEASASKQTSQLQYILTLAARRVSVFTIIVCFPLIFWGNHILSLFGSDFQAAYPVLIVLAFGQIVNAFTGPVGVIMTMTDNQKYSLYITIGSALLNIVLNYILINSYGIIGAAIATSITLSSWNIILVFMVQRRLGVNSTIFVRS